MITKYYDFITESNYTEANPEFWGITNYKWVNGRLDCYQDVNLKNKELTKLPFDFGTIQGDFRCNKNLMTSLEGSPSKVYGNFVCSENQLTSLDFCPSIVSEGFFCQKNLLWDNSIIGLENYPVCMISHELIYNTKNDNQISSIFWEVTRLIKKNKEIFLQLLDDKIKFHQQIMRLRPDFIQYYKTINPPTKKSIL